MTDDLLPAMAAARARFMELVAEVRPELHRYCARMAGNTFDGEDIVQDTLAKAHFALSEMGEPPPLRPWLFRIAHNTAMDFLRRYEHKHVDLVAETPELGAGDAERAPDPALVETALTVFVSLPPTQRSAIVLKDVLDRSIDEIASTMGTTVLAVKGALSRARANIAKAAAAPALSADEQQSLQRYAELFNAHDWDGLRALLADEARLDVVTRWQRRGAGAGFYARYAQIIVEERLRAEAGFADGVPVIAVYRPASARPAYFIRLTWERGRIVEVRDFYYVTYIADETRYLAAQ